jgi:pimeloyl-ACP methyl ester carboxylesterase
MIRTAEKLHNETGINIHLYALEHRYYGKSYPDFGGDASSPVTNENLVYLNSRQALADLAHFASSVQINEFILFGGSYPGMLAAWARAKYPHVFSGAVSNSAPVQAVLDFAAYDNHVAKDFRNPALGGSDECLEIVKQGHEFLAALVRVKPTLVAQQFHLCNATALADRKNVQAFMGDGVLAMGAQENDPACDQFFCNIQRKCQALTQHYEGLLDKQLDTHSAAGLTLQWAANRQNGFDGEDDDDCLEVDWRASLEYIADPVRGQAGGLRSWLWQTCTEFGFYQTCEKGSDCPFAKGLHPLSQDLEICEKAFGVSPQQVADAVRATNEYTGGWKLKASRVLSVTGTADPWSEMAIQDTKNPSVYRVESASHHFWTHQVLPTDDVNVQKAREFITQTVREWLEQSTMQEKKGTFPNLRTKAGRIREGDLEMYR